MILETAFAFLIVSKCLVTHAALSSVSAIPLSRRPSECMNKQTCFWQTLTSLDVKALRHTEETRSIYTPLKSFMFSAGYREDLLGMGAGRNRQKSQEERN